MSHRSIIVLPDDTGKPIIDAINAAKKSIRVKMFIFSDPDLIKAVIAAKDRGLKVHVMLNPARRSGEEENEETRKTLEKAGIEVKDSNPDFGITHEKSMVVDDETAFVKSLNWETKNLTVTRDYAVVTSHKHEVDEVIAGFEADWHRKDFDPGERRAPHLVPRQRARTHRPPDRRRQAHPLRPERALPGLRHHRAPRPRRDARREGPRHGAPAAFT